MIDWYLFTFAEVPWYMQACLWALLPVSVIALVQVWTDVKGGGSDE